MKLKSTPKKEVTKNKEEEAPNQKPEISNSQMIEILSQQITQGNDEEEGKKKDKNI